MKVVKELKLRQTRSLDNMRFLIILVPHIKHLQIELFIHIDRYIINILGINLILTQHQMEEEVLLELL